MTTVEKKSISYYWRFCQTDQYKKLKGYCISRNTRSNMHKAKNQWCQILNLYRTVFWTASRNKLLNADTMQCNISIILIIPHTCIFFFCFPTSFQVCFSCYWFSLFSMSALFFAASDDGSNVALITFLILEVIIYSVSVGLNSNPLPPPLPISLI